ncbi:Cys-tRNA(Pro) deacylase, partial [Pseudomonas sp. MWU13-2625]
HPMPVYMESSIAELDRIYINGGKRGFLIGVDPQEVIRVLQPVLVQAAA